MKVLVTGGCGFIGSAWVRHAVLAAQWRVVNVDALTYAAVPRALDAVCDSPRYAFEHLDIGDAQALAGVFARHRPDAVLHLAAESHVDRSIKHSDVFVRTNVEGTWTVLEAARAWWMKLEPASQAAFRFLHVSTDEVFGDLADTAAEGVAAFTEASPYRPSSPYSATKAAADHLVRAWGRTYGMPVMVTHCTNNYGPWQYPEKLIPRTIALAARLQPIPVYGSGHQTRDWLHVDDHVHALNRVLQKGAPGASYAIGASQPRSNLDVVHAICDELDGVLGNRNRRSLVRHVADRPGHDIGYALDAGRMQRELGWQPRIPFEQGLRQTIHWCLEHMND